MIGDDELPGAGNPSDDLEYDLAHEGDAAGRASSPGPDPATEQHVQVATETPGFDSDYGYDLAHDVPR
jgi:hypothetical protein